MVDVGLTQGITVSYSDQIWVHWPEVPEERTTEYCREAALKTIENFGTASYERVRKAYRFLMQLLPQIETKTNLVRQVEEATTSALRTEVMVKLFQSGREDHPLYAVLAGSDSYTQITGIGREIERTSRRMTA